MLGAAEGILYFSRVKHREKRRDNNSYPTKSKLYAFLKFLTGEHWGKPTETPPFLWKPTRYTVLKGNTRNFSTKKKVLYLRLTGFELSESTAAAAFVRSLTISSCSWTGTSGLSSAVAVAVDWTGGTTWTQADMCRRCVRCDRCSGVRAVVVLWWRSTWAYTGSLSDRALWERRRGRLESQLVYGRVLGNFSVGQSGRHKPTKRDYAADSIVYCISRREGISDKM